jgi:hypothetical protein
VIFSIAIFLKKLVDFDGFRGHSNMYCDDINSHKKPSHLHHESGLLAFFKLLNRLRVKKINAAPAVLAHSDEAPAPKSKVPTLKAPPPLLMAPEVCKIVPFSRQSEIISL